MKIRIEGVNPNKANVFIDDQEIKGVTALRLDGALDKPHVLTLQMIPRDLIIEVDGQVKVLQEKMKIELGGKGRRR